ncbi:hypothetical protein L2E82_02695 [Cichorium intybus]|uniref:Uncharacterized protein n=1 Tax=Cichorium intybus TaxID=13427 RepID=A0ACB9H3Z4_CICIN|nr:hypothetical protein L2E82_02695 [Cichorium intybus]
MEWLYESLLRYSSDSFILISSSPSFSVPPLFICCDLPPSCIPPVYTYKDSERADELADEIQSVLHIVKLNLFMLLSSFAFNCIQKSAKNIVSSYEEHFVSSSGGGGGFEPETETANSRWALGARAAKVGKGVSKNEKAQKLALQHWLKVNGEEGSEVFANSDVVPAKKDPQDGDETINGMADSGLQGKRICTAEWECGVC